MRICYAFVLIAFILAATSYSHGRSIEDETNAVLGIVNEQTEGIVSGPIGEVRVELWGRGDEVRDITNHEGLYCVLIPKSVSRYQLLYKARGYWPFTSESPRDNVDDRQKIPRILLIRQTPSSVKSPYELEKLLGMTYQIWRGASRETKDQISYDLNEFRETILNGISPFPANDMDRGRVIQMIDATLNKMGIRPQIYREGTFPKLPRQRKNRFTKRNKREINFCAARAVFVQDVNLVQRYNVYL